MSDRVLAFALVGMIMASCTGALVPATPTPVASPTAEPSVALSSPTASQTSRASTPAPTLTATVTALPMPTFPVPSADPSAGVGPITAVRSAAATADGSRVVGVPASFGAPPQIEVVTIATGARRRIAHARQAHPAGLSVASGTLVYFDAVAAADGSETFGVWRIQTQDVRPTPTKLDEFPSPGGFGGGDTINPWPSPQTNGREVLWLRTRQAASRRTHELVVARGIGAPQVVHSGPQQPFYSIDEQGRIAIVTSTDKEATLAMYDPGTGRVGEIARRPAEQGGLASWVNGQLAWLDSYFNVRPASRADLFDPSTGASTSFAPPTGCGLSFPTTRRHLLVICFGGLTAVHDLATGKVAPLAPVVLATREALLLRSTAEFDAGQDAWLHAAVLPP